jgi:hypothetical protein
MTYGEKFVSFAKLAVIRSLCLQRTKESLSKAVQLLYTLSLTGKERVLSLSEFMTKFNLPLSSPYSGIFHDNTLIPTIPFFIGFILADGTLFIRLRLVKNSLYIIPMIFIPQIKTEYNTHFLSQLVLMLNYYNIGTVDKETGSMAGFTIQGFENVFEKLLPLFLENISLFYWKYPLLEQFIRVKRLMTFNAHHTLYGFIKILTIIYSYENDRNTSLAYWIDIITGLFSQAAEKMKSNHNHIWGIPGRGTSKGKTIAWKCVFPVESKLKKKQFGFTNESDSNKALTKAIEYRDTTIKAWVDSIDSTDTSSSLKYFFPFSSY